MAEPDSIPTELADDFSALNALPTSDKPDAYNQLLDTILARSSADSLEANLIAYAAFLLHGGGPLVSVQASEPLGIIASRPLLSTFTARLKDLPDPSLRATVAQRSIDLLRPRVVSFEDADTALKHLLADAHQQQEDFTSAARTLESIILDTTQRAVSDSEKAEIWVRIARCYLEDDNPTNAAAYINRAKNVLHNVDNKEIRLQFQVSQARVLDSQRHFLDAAAAYHSVSFEPLVHDDDRLTTLSAAIVCAVLAPAGPQRARTLARLYKDDRAAQTDEYAILEKIFLDRVLAPEEVANFAAALRPHQLARTADGSTVVDRAVLEHNLLGASRLYRNMRVSDLGALLGVDGDRAENYAAQMIEQGRLRGHIDQIDGVIFFDGDVSGGGSDAAKTGEAGTTKEQGAAGLGAGTAVAGAELRRWDAAVQGLLGEVEAVTTMIQTELPEFYAANMAY